MTGAFFVILKERMRLKDLVSIHTTWVFSMRFFAQFTLSNIEVLRMTGGMKDLVEEAIVLDSSVTLFPQNDERGSG